MHLLFWNHSAFGILYYRMGEFIEPNRFISKGFDPFWNAPLVSLYFFTFDRLYSWRLSFSRKFGAITVQKSLHHRLNCPPKGSVRFIQMANNLNSNSNGNNSESRGALVVLEGLDRCGKTTQSSRLHKYLKGLGHAAELWRFPDRTTSVGQMISSYLSNQSQLDDRAIHLLFSANRWEKRFALF